MMGRELADGRYVLERHVAEGGTAHVYLGYDTWTRDWRAIKTLLPEYASRAGIRHRFEREAVTMKTLSHDNIVTVYDAGVEAGTVFMVMEYAEGGSVIDWIDEHGAMPPRMATRVVLELCRGIDAAHQQGVIHRDIKPQNLLVDRHGVCKVTDFGIAQALDDDRMTMTGTVMGTLDYMAPEQHESAKHADERADVYSIAATFYTLLRGEASSHLFMAEERDLGGLPEDLAAIVDKGAQFRRERRHGSVRQLIAELEEALPHLPPDPPGTPPIVPPDVLRVDRLTPPVGAEWSAPPAPAGIPTVSPRPAPPAGGSPSQPPRREWVIGLDPPLLDRTSPAPATPDRPRSSHPPAAAPPASPDRRRVTTLVLGAGASLVLGVLAVLALLPQDDEPVPDCKQLRARAESCVYLDVLQTCRRFTPPLEGCASIELAYTRATSTANCPVLRGALHSIVDVVVEETHPDCTNHATVATGGCEDMWQCATDLQQMLQDLQRAEVALEAQRPLSAPLGGCTSAP